MTKNKRIKLLLTLTILSLFHCAISARNPLDSSQPIGAIYQLLPIFFPSLKPSSAKEMKTYFIPTTGSSAVITGTKMSLIVPYSTDLSSLSAEFYHTGKSATVNGIEQISGQTLNSYSQALVYTITALNATQKSYTLSTTKGNPDSNTLFGFQFESINTKGLISGTSVLLNVPYGTDVKNLIPTFSHNGSKVFLNATEQVSGKTANDFTNPLLYEIQAENGSRKQYTIVVVSGTLTSNTIQGISVDGIEGAITGDSIYFNFTPGQNISSVSPIISHLGSTITVNGLPFVNGETTLDLTLPQKVKITSADGTVKEYTIYVGYVVATGTGTTTGTTTGTGGTSFYIIGGSVSGLIGTVVLRNNGGNDLSISANGAFTFSMSVANLYSVTVLTQPTGQTCTISNSSGTASANVTNVNVSCATSTYKIGGTVGGLSGGTLVLQNNGGDNKSLTANGIFEFTASISHNGAYNVTVLTNPTNQFCSVTNGTGTATGTVTTIIVDCNNLPGTTVQSFTDLGNQTIQDNNTGLIWMKCSMSNVPGVPRSGSDCLTGTVGTYQFCSTSNHNCNGGVNTLNLQPSPWLSGSTSSLWTACNNANTTPVGGFAGKTNWRVPTKDELVSLVDYSISTTDPKINETYFPNTVANGYWSSTTYAPVTADAWGVGFYAGGVFSSAKTLNDYVRCVSGP